jgi:hypothetical protein
MLVGDAAEALSVADFGVEREQDRVVVVGWAVATAAALVGPMAVEVLRALGQDDGRVPLVLDQHPVGALGADGPHEPFGNPLAAASRGGPEPDLNILGGEHGVEAVGVLPAAVSDQVGEGAGALAEVGK